MLKIYYRTLVASVLLVGNTALLASPLLIRSSNPGYIAQELELYTTCTLDDKGFLIIENKLNGLISQEKKKLNINSKNIKKIIASASLGMIVRPDDILDRAYVSYIAYQKQHYGKVKSVFIWEDNGVPEANKYNDSSAASTLRKFMDTICK